MEKNFLQIHYRHKNAISVCQYLHGINRGRDLKIKKGLDNLKIFIDYLNNIHSTIKFTSSHSSTNIPFLDVSVSLTNDGSISTDLYTKPTDKHQHLLYSSCHPLHTKKAIPFSLALRLRRICSTDATFHTRTAQLTTYLLKRGYNRNFVNKQIRRAAESQGRK